MGKGINYEEDMAIDNTALDVEWLSQASLMMKYVRLSAEAKRVMDNQKEAVDIIKAQLDKEIRTSPELYGILKITEMTVYNAILENPRFLEANQEYTNARYESDMAYGAVRAIEQRKTALENLVRLYGSSYFAGPSIPRNLNKEWENSERQKQANRHVAISPLKKQEEEPEKEEVITPTRRRRN